MEYDAGPMEMDTASRGELIASIAEQRAAIERLEAWVRELEAGVGGGKSRGLAGNKLEPKRPPKSEGERKRRGASFPRPRHPKPHARHPEGTRRPLVTARKISGGTRSPTGTDTKMALASLSGTWLARGLAPCTSCLQMLTSPQPCTLTSRRPISLRDGRYGSDIVGLRPTEGR